MEYQNFDCEIADGTARVRLIGPGAPELADLCDDFTDLMLRLQDDQAVRVIMFTDGDHSFEFPHHLEGLSQFHGKGSGFDTMSADEEISRRMVTLLAEASKPVVAATRGDIRDMGLGLFLAADIRLASEKASFTATPMICGMLPGWGLFHTLPRLIGPGRTLEFLWSNRTLGAEEAWRLGLVDRLIPDQSWDQDLDDFTARLSNLPQPAVHLSKLAMQQHMILDHTMMMAFEWESQQQCWTSPETAEGMCAFQEGRAPQLTATTDAEEE